ncbi:DUF4199 domain-containing protein [Cryomorpha ignava]|uniref:DUF4199 domain-containing protein n=1 Tax=Cryomorpha ignava TaxID=101383 RepID=A0A7K3WR21_9FLAO|nr:DUF4199 domain-containing protein [Cryomorpha ignava]NEN23292.1 DUF4199 domain-containing protein [Cryomorpha ignava]
MNKSYALNLGLTTAVLSIVLFLLMAILGGGMILSFAIGILALAFMIALPIIFVRKQRKANNGIISYKDAFLTSFVGLAIGGIVYLAFSFIYVNFIDTTYLDKMINQQIETTMSFMQGNVPEEQMVETLTEIETKTREGFTLPGMLKNLGIYLIVYAVFSLILAAIMKRNPVIVSTSEDIIDN